MGASLWVKLKSPYRTQNRPTFEPLVLGWVTGGTAGKGDHNDMGIRSGSRSSVWNVLRLGG
jgi:hypothetical protein